MKIARRQLRKLILEVINEINVSNKQIEVVDGNINVNGELFSIQANAGWKTAGQFVNVELTSIDQVPGGLQVTGNAIGTSVNDLVPDEKVAEIINGVSSPASSFNIQGKKALFRFSRV